MNQVIRIIGGLYRGKKLHFPEVQGLRPTPDRVRETLFNWLMNDIHDARCLDAFAGSGALGFEAFSRGAKEVIFVENSAQAHANLQKNMAQFHSPKLKLIKANTLVYLQKTASPFDIIFLDPPFGEDYLPQCLNEITNQQLLLPGGLVYIESGSAVTIDDHQWRLHKLKQAGQVHYGLFEKL